MINKNDYEFHAPLFETNSYTCNNISTTTRYNKNGDSKNRCPVVLSLSLMAVLVMFYQTVIVKNTINFNCVNLLQYLFCAARK